jgi:hypothetical protein
MLINSETAAIGTAYLRLDLLPGDAQPTMRDLMRRYVDIRATVYRGADDVDAVKARIAEAAELQDVIWEQAIAAFALPGASTQAVMLLVPALNDMFDIAGTRAMATSNHPPPVIFVLLIVLSLIAAMLVGYATSPNKDRSWFHQVTFALVTSMAIYVIIDIEYPRVGLIKVDGADQAMIDLAKGFR